jgi:hypothetical protein
MQSKTKPARIEPEHQRFPDWGAAAIALVGGLLLSVVMERLPLLGWDWYWVFWKNADTSTWYPPWTAILLSPIVNLPWRWGFAIICGLTLAAVGIVTYRQRPGRWGFVAAAMATLSVPVVVLLWDGQIDGVALIGYLLLPWGTPLLLIKPTLGVWALLARKQWIIAGIVFGALSLLIWGWWPEQIIRIHVISNYTHPLFGPHPAEMGWYKLGWPIALVGLGLMLYTNRKDPMHLMAAGSFLMPYVFPYHFILLIPVLGRFQGIRQLTLWLASWMLILPFALGAKGALIGYIFPLAAWYYMWSETSIEDTWLDWLRGVGQMIRRKQSA